MTNLKCGQNARPNPLTRQNACSITFTEVDEMGVLKQVYAVQYYVKDWERAKTFYGQTLGLPSLGAADDFGWAEYGDKDQTHLAINIWREDKPMPVNGAIAIFSVDDAHAAVKELRARGVKCDDPVPIPNMVTYADFYDPEGNKLELAELAGPPPKM
jgi:predicted enzyme related to lactoylglutathione lyase